MNTPNTHLLIVKYLGATNIKPARYKIISERFKQSVIKSYGADQSFDSTIEYAIDTLKKMGFTVTSKAEGKECDYITSDTFLPLTPIKD